MLKGQKSIGRTRPFEPTELEQPNDIKRPKLDDVKRSSAIFGLIRNAAGAANAFFFRDNKENQAEQIPD